ncbi:efflux RND transporter periplasmic adaptor subunit [Serratia marcescens]|uniref:efflux RND transporter periplasmic adaptor subunit n=1 Tax=Serratia marcescens TaxID=615 RepID=UPI002FD8D167
MKTFSTRSLALCLTSLVSMPVLLAGCGSEDETAEAARPAFVIQARDAAGAGESFIGRVRATQRAELAFPVSGKVAAVLVEPGDVVRVGQVLARLDALPFSAQAAATAGDVVRAEAAFAEVQRRAERLEVARKADAVSPGETTAMAAELAAAHAQLRNARAQRDLAGWSQQQAVLRAPFNGFVAARNIEAGQAIGPGVPAMAIDGAGRELLVVVPGDIALKSGQEVLLRNGKTELVSRVLRVDGRLDVSGVRTAYLSVPDNATVGSTWSVAIRQGKDSDASAVAQVPLRAVIPAATAGRGQVLRLARDGRTTVLADVRLGELHGEWIDVTHGLAVGERVVVAGARAIRPGTIVEPVPFQPGTQQ